MTSPTDVPLVHYQPDRMVSTSDTWVPALNSYRVRTDQFPPGLTVRRQTFSVAQTLRQVWMVLEQVGFRVSDQRPPVLPVTHHWIDDSTAHGTLLAERGISPIAVGLLARATYWSEAILLTLDADLPEASAPGASMEGVLPHTVVVQGGRVLSVFRRGKHHQWRDLTSVDRVPALTPVCERIAESLRAGPLR